MKPWLFDILACPIDKLFPLKLYIFSFETKPKELSSFIEIYEKRDYHHHHVKMCDDDILPHLS